MLSLPRKNQSPSLRGVGRVVEIDAVREVVDALGVAQVNLAETVEFTRNAKHPALRNQGG